MSNRVKENEQFQRLQSKAMADREKLKESKYLSMFTDLLEKHKAILYHGIEGIDKNYSSEFKLLRNAMTIERDSIVSGAVIGLTAFVSVRYSPRVLLRAIGGEKKVQLLREADVKSRKAPLAMLRRTGTLLLEGSFACWAGWRAYNASGTLQSRNMYNDITKIPLCEGKSIVSDTICDEWIELVNNTIPQSYWANLDTDKGLSDEHTWRAILTFSENCAKRKIFEERMKKSQGLPNNESIYIPKPGVPENYLDLTKEEAESLIGSKQK